MLNIFNRKTFLNPNFRAETKRKRLGAPKDQMTKNVRKILESADQGLIVMVRG